MTRTSQSHHSTSAQQPTNRLLSVTHSFYHATSSPKTTTTSPLLSPAKPVASLFPLISVGILCNYTRANIFPKNSVRKKIHRKKKKEKENNFAGIFRRVFFGQVQIYLFFILRIVIRKKKKRGCFWWIGSTGFWRRWVCGKRRRRSCF